MHKQWIGCHASNFRPGRAGFEPEAIVVHAGGGSLADIAARCRKPNVYSSTHYAVGINGEVHQYVEEKDAAFHAGLIVNPVWSAIKKGKNPNLYTLAIEQEELRASQDELAQYKALAALVADIARRWKIKLDKDHIVLHSEIRAGAGCPGKSFDRAKLLALLDTEPDKAPVRETEANEVRVLRDANIREFPKSTARIIRVARSGTSEQVLGFESQGERIKGNAYWHHTEDGFYLWAGATDNPAPGQTTAPIPLLPTVNVKEAKGTGAQIPEVDHLLTEENAAAIGPSSGREAVAIIQDLLTGHGVAGLPTIGSSTYGAWNEKTALAIQAMQKRLTLAVSGVADKPTLHKLIETPATDPRISQAYLTLVLQFPFTGLHKVLSLVAQMEGCGKFGALNRNTDRAGLSFGLIQWAQKPGRLHELLSAMAAADRQQFVSIFGAGDESVADALLNHCHKPHGGVDPSSGATVSPAFNLIDEPWLSRFRQAAVCPSFQKTQVEMALAAFTRSCTTIRSFAPELESERALGFTLDIANQFGDTGVKTIYSRVHQPGMREKDVLDAMTEETVARVDDSFKAGVRARRERFLETPALSDAPANLLA